MANTVAGTHLTGNHASRPAGNAVPDGTLYSCTTHSLIYLSNYAGNSWSTWASLTGTGLADPMTTRGDIIVRNASNVTDRLAVGATSGFVLKSDGTDVSWGYPSHTTAENFLTSPVTMTNANTFYDGPTVTIGASGQVWFLSGAVHFENTTGTATTEFGAKLWNGTAVESAADWLTRATNDRISLHLSGIVTLAGSETWKISVVNTNAGATIRDNANNNNAGDLYSYLHGVRIG